MKTCRYQERLGGSAVFSARRWGQAAVVAVCFLWVVGGSAVSEARASARQQQGKWQFDRVCVPPVNFQTGNVYPFCTPCRPNPLPTDCPESAILYLPARCDSLEESACLMGPFVSSVVSGPVYERVSIEISGCAFDLVRVCCTYIKTPESSFTSVPGCL